MAEKMIDLGKKRDMSDGCCEPCPDEDKDKVYYPSLYIDSDNPLPLPEGEFEFRAKGKKVSASYRERDGEKTSYSCEIEVMAIEPMESSDEEEEEPSMRGEDTAEALEEALIVIAKEKE